jgi:hypothetical protein
LRKRSAFVAGNDAAGILIQSSPAKFGEGGFNLLAAGEAAFRRISPVTKHPFIRILSIVMGPRLTPRL